MIELRQTTRQRPLEPVVRTVPGMFVVALLSAFVLIGAGCGKNGEAPKAAIKSEAPPVAESPLAKATIQGDIGEIKTLIDGGADVNVKDPLGRTPLHMAAFYGNTKISEFLIEHGANPQDKDAEGKTPLAYAIQNKHPQATALLQKYAPKTEPAR